MKRFLIAVVVIGVLAHVDAFLIYEAQGAPAWKSWPGAYAVFGLIACIALIGIAKLLAALGIVQKGDEDD